MIDAAVPGSDRASIDRYHDTPSPGVLAACPVCGDPDHLALIERTLTARAIYTALFVPGATDPDVTDSDPTPVPVDGPPPLLVAVRCETCRWSRESPDCLHYLTKATT